MIVVCGRDSGGKTVGPPSGKSIGGHWTERFGGKLNMLNEESV